MYCTLCVVYVFYEAYILLIVLSPQMFNDAGALYEKCEQWEKAASAYVKSKNWLVCAHYVCATHFNVLLIQTVQLINIAIKPGVSLCKPSSSFPLCKSNPSSMQAHFLLSASSFSPQLYREEGLELQDGDVMLSEKRKRTCRGEEMA